MWDTLKPLHLYLVIFSNFNGCPKFLCLDGSIKMIKAHEGAMIRLGNCD